MRNSPESKRGATSSRIARCRSRCPWWDLLAFNHTYAALIGGLEDRPSAERNILWLTFAQSHMSHLLVDWPVQARQLVGQLRTHLAEFPADPRGPELVEALRTASPKFTDLWKENDVRQFETARKRFLHPDAGRLDLDYVKLEIADHDQQHLVVFLPADKAGASKLVGLN